MKPCINKTCCMNNHNLENPNYVDSGCGNYLNDDSLNACSIYTNLYLTTCDDCKYTKPSEQCIIDCMQVKRCHNFEEK